MYHTYDIVDAAERMMEIISYDTRTPEEKAYAIIKRMMHEKDNEQKQ